MKYTDQNISPESLKTYPGFENQSSEELEKTSQDVQMLAQLAFKYMIRNQESSVHKEAA